MNTDRPHVPAIDGLRALAVAAVFVYHAEPARLPGGFLGVEIFFVISGYLITGLLLDEWSARGALDLPGFWLRRARRLLPALFLLLAGVLGFVALALPGDLAGLRGDTWSGLVYVNNWHQIFSHTSYFQSVGRPPLLRHLWSLSVEEQFYLLWPPILGLLLRGRRLALPAMIAGAALSALWMAALYQPEADPSRVYYGTDTRAAGLLIGSALAGWRIRPGCRTRAGARAGAVTGVLALVALAVAAVALDESRRCLYRGGFLATALATAALIASLRKAPASPAAALLALPPMRWIGQRSYGIYLWHYPVLMVTRPGLDVALDGASLMALRVLLVGSLAALSYRAVEQPIRYGALGRLWARWRSARGAERGLLGTCGLALLLGLVALGTALGASLAGARVPEPPAYLAALAAPPPPAAPACDAGPAAAPGPPDTTQAPDAVTAVGDSVLLGARDQLMQALGTNLVVDAELGRQAWHVPATLQRLREAGALHPTVILHIGDNGTISEATLDRIMEALSGAHRVAIVTVRTPRPWEAPNNARLAAAARSHTNAVLVDWNGASAGRPEWFWKDRLHLRPDGAAAYAGLIAAALRGPAPAAPTGGLAAVRP